MRKRKKGRKLSRKRNQRKALLKSLAASLLLKEKIETTEAKAKEISCFVEKQISLARKNFTDQDSSEQARAGTLPARRLLRKQFSPQIVKKLVSEIGLRYKNRPGGYTRIIKLGPRKSDGAKMAIIELVK